MSKSVCLRGVLIGLGVLLCTTAARSDGDEDFEWLRHAIELHKEVKASPVSSLWIHNRSGRAIYEVTVRWASERTEGRSRSGHNTWHTKIEAKPVQAWWDRWPDPLIIQTVELRFAGEFRQTYPLKQRCLPGQKILLEVDAKLQARVRPNKK
jgi:hypothetical protein